MSTKFIPLIFIIIYFLTGCSKTENKDTDDATSYNVRGKVVDIDTASSRVNLAHHDIPGLMKAMTMPFKVKNPALLKMVFIGDSISGTLVASETEYYLDTLSVIWRDTASAR